MLGSSPRELSSQTVASMSEGKKALYVGRSNQIRERIGTHGRKSATQEQANFAFRLMAKKYHLDIGHSATVSRSQIAKKYAAEFREQKQKVREMTIRAVEITDDTVSYFFEAYAILALGTTEFNKFEPH